MRRTMFALAIIWSWLWALNAFAQHEGPSTNTLPPPRPQEVNTISITPLTPVEGWPTIEVETAPLPDIGPDRMLERYMDGVFASQIAAGRIPGGAIVVIRNGAVILKKGYGFANLEKKTPIDPDTTRFRVASITKLFTALAAMQEVEAGRLSLDADVNGYLKTFKLMPVGPRPVSLGTLLDHTAGFDDLYVGVSTAIGAPREELGRHLARKMPPLVLPAGRVFNYSNYGSALAGHLVAQAATTDFSALMASRFFTPLRMKHSTIGIPLPIPVSMATPYRRTPLGLVPARFDQSAPYPAGDLVTTAGDMSEFILALVNETGRLVQPATLKSMLTPRVAPGKAGDGWGLGFALGESNGVTWFGHGGAWPGFAAELRLNADTKSGFLILLNTDNSFDIVQPIVNAVTDGVWPSQGPVKVAKLDTAYAMLAAADLEGTFWPVRRARADFTKIGGGLASIRLTALGQGTLTGSVGNVPQRLVFEPESEGIWRERTFRWRLTAYDGQGIINDGLALGPFIFERAGFTNDLTRQGPWIGAAAAVFASVLAVWGMGAFSRRMFGEPMAAVEMRARILGATTATLALMFLVGLASVLSLLNDQDILGAQLGILPILLWLPLIIAPLTLGVGYFAIRGFGAGLRNRLAQTGFGLLTLSLAFVLWFAWTWNLHIFAR